MNRLQSLVISVLVVLGLFGPSTSWARTAGDVETRVRGIDLFVPVVVGVVTASSPDLHRVIDGFDYEDAVGATLAAGEVGALRFSQTTASPFFSAEGTFAGKTIGGLSSELRAGTVAASEVPVGYVTIGGNNLLVNTRSALSLMRAGIPQSSWTLIDMTATDAAAINARLLSNGLTVEGTSTLRITGMGQFVSNLQ